MINIEAYDLTKLTNEQINDLYLYTNQIKLESISPKLEQFRDSKYRINVAYGGRGAGAKSWSFDSLLVQKANRKKIKVACFREIQKSLKESSYANIKQQVERLGYSGWTFQNEYIKAPNGSIFIFRGLKDMTAAQQIKSFENFDVFRIEEGDAVSYDSWMILLPTLRKKGSQIFITFNPTNDSDPVAEIFINNKRGDCLSVFCEPEHIDNPWWFDSDLHIESEELKKRNYDEWLHIFGGQPRKQGFNAVLNRSLVDAAMKREIEAQGQEIVGCDPADFGDDKTQIYKRKGLKVMYHKELLHQDGIVIANNLSEIANRSNRTCINIDVTGIGTSTRDQAKALGLNVNPINFAQAPRNKDKYADFSTELWFDFREKHLNECSIPNDPELRQELCGRLYSYDNKGRYKIESKKDFKKRLGRSPDKADALLLAFYTPPINAGGFAAGV